MNTRILAIVAIFALAACGEAETCAVRDVGGSPHLVCPDGSKTPLTHGDAGCSVEELDDGTFVVHCDDESEVIIRPGKNGRDGVDGKDGEDGGNGRDGTDGLNGRDGKDGKDGRDGADGSDGKDGSDGTTSLVRLVEEPPGASCPAGGWHVFTGLDLDGDGVLDLATEVVGHALICHGGDGMPGSDGRDGQDGQDGRDGEPRAEPPAILVRVDRAPPSVCPFGGVLFLIGADLDGDGMLGDEEIQQSEEICHPKPFLIGWELRGLGTLRAGERSLVGFKAVLSGTLDPLHPLRWRVRLVDEGGAPVAGASLFMDDGTDGDGAGGAGGDGGDGGHDEGGAGGTGGDAPQSAPPHLAWSKEYVTDSTGAIVLDEPFTSKASGLESGTGVEVWLSLEAPPEGAYALQVELVDADDLNTLDESAPGHFDTLPAGGTFHFISPEDFLPNVQGIFGVVPLLGAEVDPGEQVRLRLRLEEKIGVSMQPRAGHPLFDLEGIGPADRSAWGSQPIATDLEGEAFFGPASLPAGALQGLTPETFLLAGAFPAGAFRLTFEAVSMATEEVVGFGSISFTLPHTETDLVLHDLEDGSSGRDLVGVALRLSTEIDPGENIRFRLQVREEETPMGGVTFYYDALAGGPSDHHAWTDSFQTDGSGQVIHPVVFQAADFHVAGWKFLYLSMGALPPQANLTLEVTVERVSDGAVLATGSAALEPT